MKKITLLLTLLFLLFACSKEEKFPTKKDLKGHWTRCESTPGEDTRFAKEVVFYNKTLQFINRNGSSTHSYKLDITSKRMSIFPHDKSGYGAVIVEIWINKTTGLLHMKDISSPWTDLNKSSTYKKME
jgi:hypothetical protein